MPTRAKSLKKASKGCASINDMFRATIDVSTGNVSTEISDDVSQNESAVDD